MKINDTIKKFWTERLTYPNYPNTPQRRFIDTEFILDRVAQSKSLLDLGCGEGSVILALREFTNIIDFYGYDMSPGLLDILKRKWGDWPGLHIEKSNIININYPKTDVTISLGSFPYVMDDDLESILKAINSDLFIVRSPCTSKKEDEIINKYSEELKENYAAIYRTVHNYIGIFSKYFVVDVVKRVYPDNLEGKYGTKHFWFVCKHK